MVNGEFLLAATLPTELHVHVSIHTANSFQNHARLLNTQPKCFDLNVYKQTNVNIDKISLQYYSILYFEMFTFFLSMECKVKS